jgi:hypothetical protein
MLLQQIEKLLAGHEAKLAIWSSPAPAKLKKTSGKKVAAKNTVAKKAVKKISGKKAKK